MSVRRRAIKARIERDRRRATQQAEVKALLDNLIRYCLRPVPMFDVPE